MRGWIETPDRPPHRCALTLRTEPEDGPYYSLGLVVYPAIYGPDGSPSPDRRAQHLYLSPQALREAAGAPGSPVVVLTKQDDAEREAILDGLRSQVETLQEHLAESQVEAARLQEHLNPQQMAGALVGMLDERYARKTGRKPAPRDAA